MLGEELNAAWLTPRGLLGDRAFALISGEDDKVVSAKNPRKWPGLFDFRATYVCATRLEQAVAPGASHLSGWHDGVQRAVGRRRVAFASAWSTRAADPGVSRADHNSRNTGPIWRNWITATR